MKNTYINNNMSSPYPFAADTVLPFPLYSIIGCGICLVADADLPAQNKSVCISSLELAEDSVVATVIAPDGTQAGTIEWHDGMSICKASRVAGWSMTGWIMPGSLDEGCWGTYHGSFRLDPSCVTLMTRGMAGTADTVKVNGSAHDMPPILSMTANGYINGDDVSHAGMAPGVPGVMPGDTLWKLSGTVPNGARMTNAVEPDNYSQVTAINNTVVPTGAGTSGVLLLKVDVISSGVLLTSNAVEPFVSIYVDNAHFQQSIRTRMTVDPATGQRSTFAPRLLFGQLSDAVIITIIGGKRIPNCYDGEADDASTDMTSSWTNLKPSSATVSGGQI